MGRGKAIYIGGSILLENGRFYIKIPNDKKREMPLVAEGIRKLAMLLYLLLNGSLRKQSILFWDEPETNLNPKLIRKLAEILLIIAGQGIQIVLATHNLFLIKEIDILMKLENKQARCFGLSFEEGKVILEQSDDLEEIHTILALDEELAQSDRYQNWYEGTME